jgi:hypothetical protein
MEKIVSFRQLDAWREAHRSRGAEERRSRGEGVE